MEKKNKTHSSGESLSELLVASLIISLAMIMLFSGIKVGLDSMNNSRKNYQLYNQTWNEYEESQASYVILYEATNPNTTPSSFSFAKRTMMSPFK